MVNTEVIAFFYAMTILVDVIVYVHFIKNEQIFLMLCFKTLVLIDQILVLNQQ